MNKLKVTAIQLMVGENKEKNIENIIKLIDKAAKEKPDIIVLPELCTTPYWCAARENKYFKLAETFAGPAFKKIAKLANKYSCSIILPVFEKGLIEGEYYNSAFVIGPDGKLIQGVLPDGNIVNAYRKVHLPVLNRHPVYLDEKYYFRSGSGFPVFATPKVSIGVVICWDRCFPEIWRVLSLGGAKVIFMVSALLSWTPSQGVSRSEQFLTELKTRAMENQIYVVGCNRCGEESITGTSITFFGQSCIINPFGEVLSRASSDDTTLVTNDLDIELINEARLTLPFYHDRRPDLYKAISDNR
jgi:N-carbamoylputrescine amidase